MAGSAVALPTVLAGPILQRITPTRATLFLATSAALTFNKLAAEVWDPLPDGLSGYLAAPDPVAGLAGGLRTPYNVETRAIGKELFIHRIVLDAESGGWPGNRALAYRVAPTGTDWLPPPGGSHALPRDPDVVREVHRMLSESAKASAAAPRFTAEQMRRSLELITRYVAQQGLIPRAYAVDELFDDVARALI